MATMKMGESAIYTLKNNGVLEDTIHFLEIGNEKQAVKKAVTGMQSLNVGLSMQLDIKTYDSTANEVHSFTTSTGMITDQAFASTVVFKPDNGNSKFAIATLYIGS